MSDLFRQGPKTQKILCTLKNSSTVGHVKGDKIFTWDKQPTQYIYSICDSTHSGVLCGASALFWNTPCTIYGKRQTHLWRCAWKWSVSNQTHAFCSRWRLPPSCTRRACWLRESHWSQPTMSPAMRLTIICEYSNNILQIISFVDLIYLFFLPTVLRETETVINVTYMGHWHSAVYGLVPYAWHLLRLYKFIFYLPPVINVVLIPKFVWFFLSNISFANNVCYVNTYKKFWQC